VSKLREADRIEEGLIAMEHRALERWCRGDPSGYLEITAPDVVYFDPFLERRIDGIEALTAYYEGLRGKNFAARFELLNPRVQRSGDMAVLTFNFVSYGASGAAMRWNCTEVYRRDGGDFRLIQSHWSRTKPSAAG
jgi:ketosteroid isomerase-like protein